MDDNEKDTGRMFFVLFIAILMACFYLFGYFSGVRCHKQEAVDSGYAEWCVDTDAHVEFKWKEKP